MEVLPPYIDGQVPQSAFDALLSRTAAHISATHPDARILLESFVENQKAPAYDSADAFEGPPRAIDHFPAYTERPSASWRADPDPLTAVKQAFVMEFFEAIRREDVELIVLFIQHNIVSANTTNENGQTPLLAAISMKCIPIVKELLDLGADPDMFGTVIPPAANQPTTPSSYWKIDIRTEPLRTPLMLAASVGSLPIVKLLLEPPYCANDALVASDGQIALRIASDNGHRAIVDYLPSRRAGHLRFKAHNSQNIARAKRALWGIVYSMRFFMRGFRFFFWTLPKHWVVLPTIKSCKRCWAERDKFGPWCKRQAHQFPGKVWSTFKAVPRVVRKFGNGIWRFCTVTLPEWVEYLALWCRELVTEHIPRATRAVIKWLWEGARLLGYFIWDILLRVISFLHTVFEAIATFLQNVTLRDVGNALYGLILAISVTFPKSLWSWIKKIERACYKATVALFGVLGWLVYMIAAVTVYAAMSIPRKLWTILAVLGNSITKAAHEVVVWINPKA